MRVPIVRMSALIVACLFTVACSTGPGGSPSGGPGDVGPGDVGLANTSWTVTSLAGAPVAGHDLLRGWAGEREHRL